MNIWQARQSVEGMKSGLHLLGYRVKKNNFQAKKLIDFLSFYAGFEMQQHLNQNRLL